MGENIPFTHTGGNIESHRRHLSLCTGEMSGEISRDRIARFEPEEILIQGSRTRRERGEASRVPGG
jgi:hypothetical protein